MSKYVILVEIAAMLLAAGVMGCGKPEPEKKNIEPAMLNDVDLYVAFWPEKETRITNVKAETPSGKSFEFVLKTGPLKAFTEQQKKVKYFWGWGGDELDPSRMELTHEMKLVWNGKNIPIPEEAFADLEDLRIGMNHFMWEGGGYFVLLLEGSDAGEIYDVKMIFRDNKLLRREITHGEFPEMPPEVKTFCDEK